MNERDEMTFWYSPSATNIAEGRNESSVVAYPVKNLAANFSLVQGSGLFQQWGVVWGQV